MILHCTVDNIGVIKGRCKPPFIFDGPILTSREDKDRWRVGSRQVKTGTTSLGFGGSVSSGVIVTGLFLADAVCSER